MEHGSVMGLVAGCRNLMHSRLLEDGEAPNWKQAGLLSYHSEESYSGDPSSHGHLCWAVSGQK